MSKTAISIIIPCKNEAEIINSTISAILGYIESSGDLEAEIIVVDDGSTDRTLAEIEPYVSDGRVKLLLNQQNYGKGYSVRRGALAAQHKLVFFTDADLSSPIDELGKLFEGINEGYDIAIGSRSLPDSQITVSQPFYRVLVGKLGNLLIRAMLDLPFKDTQCGFKIFNDCQELFEAQKMDGWSFDYELLYKAKKSSKRIKEIPVQWANNNQSSFSPVVDSLHCFKDLLKIRFRNY